MGETEGKKRAMGPDCGDIRPQVGAWERENTECKMATQVARSFVDFSRKISPMSLSTPSSVRVDANTEANNDQLSAQRTDAVPPVPAASAGSPPAHRIAINSRKRAHEDSDAMQVGGVDSEDSGAESPEQDSSVEEPSSEPAIKRRRTESAPGKQAALLAARGQISEALQRGDLQQLEALLNQYPACLEYEHPVFGATPLLEAVWWGNIDVVSWLLQRGANPDADCTGFYADELNEPDTLPEALRTHALTQLMPAAGSEDVKGLCGEWGRHVLWHSPLVHATGHRNHAMLQLLLEAGAKPEAAALSAAVIARDAVGLRALLAAGADPTECPTSGPLQDASTFVVAVCDDWGWEELLAHMNRTLPAKALAHELCGVLDYCIEPIGVPLLQRLLQAGFLRVVLDPQDADRGAPGKNWLVGQALHKGNGAVACWLLQQGFEYTFDRESDAALAAHACRNIDIFRTLLPKMTSPHLQERCLHWCLVRNLELYYRTPVYNKPEAGFKRWLVQQGASPFFTPADDNLHRDYLFHMAVATGDTEVVQAFFDKYPGENFHVPGVNGLYPIEMAVERRSLAMANLLLNRELRDGAFFVELYTHVVTRVRRQNVAEGLFVVLLETILAPARATVFRQLCEAGDWKSLEFMLSFDKQVPGAWFGGLRDHCPEPLRSQLEHLLLQADLLRWPRGVADAPAWIASATAGSVLEQLGLEASAPGTAFAPDTAKRLEGSGLTGEITSRLQGLGERYGYLRAALIDGDRDTAAAGQQLAIFAGHWLPTTPVWATWLTEDMNVADGRALSRPLVHAQTERIVAQLNDLRDAGKTRAIAWATQLRTQLPVLCANCVDAETERVDLPKAEQALQRLAVFGPNARPLAVALQRAYAAVVSSGATSSLSAGGAGTLSQLYRGFADRLLAEVCKVLAAPDEVGLSQPGASAAINRLSQDDYQRLHGGGKALTGEFIVEAQQLMAEMIDWQRDAILKALGLAPGGQASTLDRKALPFDRFAQALPQHADILNERRFAY